MSSLVTMHYIVVVFVCVFNESKILSHISIASFLLTFAKSIARDETRQKVHIITELYPFENVGILNVSTRRTKFIQ